MTKTRALLTLLTFLYLAVAPAWAEVNGDEVAQTPKRFYQAVNGKDYAVAWGLLTETSKARLAKLVADEAKMPEADVRKLFDTTDPKIRDGFWESYRNSAKPDTFVGFSYKSSGEQNGFWIVDATPPDGEPIKMQVKDEGGMKFGLVETYKI